ncbi:ACT domain-containing protein, partial [uncultured Helicobacter sp.]
ANALNLPVKESELPSVVKPYLELMQKLGFLAVQANKGVITSIHIEAQGEIGAYVDSLKTFALVGALNASLGDKINYVNAPFVAKERGIEVKTSIKQVSDTYKNHIYITLSTQNESISLSGTVFEDRHLRLTSINHFQFDIEPKGRIIFFRNTDVPGVIGLVGSTLGNHQVNIADFRLARQNKEAMAVILVDSQLPEVAIKQLEEIPACLSVKVLNI